MIKDYKIIFGFAATNLIENNYYPLSKICIEEITKNEYVDEFIIVDANSIDKTVEVHQNISNKVQVLKYGKTWDTINLKGCGDEHTWWDQTNTIHRHCSKRAEEGERIILGVICAEDIFNKEFSEELRIKIETMINDKIDTFGFPITKVYTKDFAEKKGARDKAESRWGFRLWDTMYKLESFSKLWSGFSFREHLEKTRRIKTNHALMNFEHTARSYDNWFFTKEQFINKCRTHADWVHRAGEFKNISDSFSKMVLNKFNAYGGHRISADYHQNSIKKIIKESLAEKHLGHNYFGMMI